MIDIDMMTIIDDYPYRCIRVYQNTAVLQPVGNPKRTIEVDKDTCPYIDSDSKKLITPNKALVIKAKIKKQKRHKAKTIDIMKIIKEEVDMSISRDLVYFVRDHIETLIANLALEAKNNVIRNGDKRLAPRHWYWLEVPIHGTQHIVREQDEIASEIKENYWE
jgi:hypothetical protein|tara:strand:- start:3636 stop:4124 length:489 start_codon:yes stop_codon:yes gene_type:complete